MTSSHVICGLGPPQSKILATPMVGRRVGDRKIADSGSIPELPMLRCCVLGKDTYFPLELPVVVAYPDGRLAARIPKRVLRVCVVLKQIECGANLIRVSQIPFGPDLHRA